MPVSMLLQSAITNTNMDTIEINGKIFNESEILQLIELVTELVDANNELNARMIAFNAKLQNEENKTKHLSNKVNYYESILNINTNFTA